MRSNLTLVLVPVALILGLWLGAGPAARAQSSARWEYRTAPWTIDDTTWMLRQLTGDELSSAESMAQNLERGVEPIDDTRVQALVQARLQERLEALGAEGWEVFWISETRAVVGGVLLPAPRLVAKRRTS